MSQPVNTTNINRREFLKQGGSLAAGAAVLGSISPVAAGQENP